MLVEGMVGLLILIVFWHLKGEAAAIALDNIIHARYACKEWQEGKIVPRKTMRKILELAQRAPSCFNVQPYKIVIVESDEGKEKLAQAMHGPNPRHIRSSSFAAVFAADPDPIPLLGQDPPDFKVQAIEKVSLAQQSTPQAWAVKNVMLVVDHFLLAATAHGLQTNPMEGFQSQEAVRKAVGIPEKYDVPIVVAVGYENYAKHARPPVSSRRPLEEMCFLDEFGQPFEEWVGMTSHEVMLRCHHCWWVKRVSFEAEHVFELFAIPLQSFVRSHCVQICTRHCRIWWLCICLVRMKTEFPLTLQWSAWKILKVCTDKQEFWAPEAMWFLVFCTCTSAFVTIFGQSHFDSSEFFSSCSPSQKKALQEESPQSREVACISVDWYRLVQYIVQSEKSSHLIFELTWSLNFNC